MFQVITPNLQPGTTLPGRPVQDFKIAHNTGIIIDSPTPATATLVMGDTVPVAARFFFNDNLVSHGQYGMFGSGAGEGTAALMQYVPGYVIQKDALIAGGDPTLYPAGLFFPATMADVGFVNAAADDYHLLATSPFKGAATDGKDIGADIDAIMTGTMGVAQ
jgi:hypothetical protein